MKSNFREIVAEFTGPPVNIEAIIRAVGVDLDKKADLDPEIAGQLQRLEDGSFKISVNKADTYYRQRFTMAHELGHFLMHTHLIGEGVDDSRAYRSSPEGNFFNRSIGRREETQANQFAAKLLLPKSVLLSIAKPGMTIKEVSRKLQASIPATEIRLKALGFELDETSIVGVPGEAPPEP
ncbi:ImmA/IrrE family metallo-endopeptidase [Mameliella alba]|nr:ImmA/IrrE family metallo-endopeptidase [Mameliella alba]